MPTTPKSTNSSFGSPPNSGSSSPSRYTYDSPSRQLHSESRRRRRSNRVALENMDSPSCQIMQEFNRMILHADYNLNLRLDHAADDYAKSIQEELALSAKESSRLLRFAEGELRIELMELRRQELEEELAQFKRDVAKKMELERIEKEKREADEREKQRLEAIKREEEEEQRKKAEEEEAKRKAEVEAEERRKAAQAEADLQAKAKAEADAAAAEKAKQEAAQEAARQAALQAQQAQKAQQVIQQSAATPFAPAAQPSTVPLSTLSAALAERKATLLPEHEITHNRYLKLHQDLKPFRKQVKDYAKGRMDLEAVEKGWLGELRREVRTKAGQISSTNKANNTKALNGVRDTIRKSLTIPGVPTVDIRQYIVQPLPTLADDMEAQFPTLKLYLINEFAKSIIAQFFSEASKSTNPIDAIGLMAVAFFSDEEFKWMGISLIDILLCKIHFHCPVLFGIYGNEDTEQGRIRLGWQRDYGNFADVGVHHERMLGIGAGFSSLTLRIFRNKVPPIPGSEFWRALSCMVNTPPQELTATHFIVLNGMLKAFPEKFIFQFGQPALVALHLAVIELPKRITDKTRNRPEVENAASQLSVLKEVWQRDIHLTIG